MKINRLSNYRIEFIEKNQFSLFLQDLAQEISQHQLTELEYELSNITSTYDALIDYYSQGANDPERDRVYQQLVGRALLLSDHVTIAIHGTKEGNRQVIFFEDFLQKNCKEQ